MMSIRNLVFDPALAKLLISYLTKGFLPVKFDSRLHGGSFLLHSVKSPLTTLKICLSEMQEIIRQKNELVGNESMKNYLIGASLATKQIEELMNSITLEKINEGGCVVDLKDFFIQLQTLFSYRQKNIKIFFSINLVSGKEKVKINKYIFFELMQCLLNNALEAYSKNERERLVLVLAIIRKKRVEIQVQDFGKGLDWLTMNLIFLKGFTTKGIGHGFGLWFVKDILKTHAKSNLKIFSEKNYGTIVRFSLPVF